jgi:hypothetical protein
VEDPDLSEGEEQFLAEKKKKARQLDYQVREVWYFEKIYLSTAVLTSI